MVLAERNYYFGCHGDNPDLIDPYTDQRIKMGYAQIEMMTRLIDYSSQYGLGPLRCQLLCLELKFQDRFLRRGQFLRIHQSGSVLSRNSWNP